MKRKNIIILITRKLPEKIEKKLKEDFKVVTNKTDKKFSTSGEEDTNLFLKLNEYIIKFKKKSDKIQKSKK